MTIKEYQTGKKVYASEYICLYQKFQKRIIDIKRKKLNKENKNG